MEFLAILVAWAAVQFWGSGGRIQQDDWLRRFYAFFSWAPTPIVRLNLCVILPMVSVFIVYHVLDEVAFGVFAFLLAVAVLLYSLGRGDFQILLRLYLNSWQRGDLEGAYRHAQDFSCELGEMQADNAAELHETVRRAVFYQGFERWFAVVFWFVLAGPALALAYRLLFLLLREPQLSQVERDASARVLFYMEWVPAQLLGLAFALIGNFDRGISALKAHFGSGAGSAELLDDVGQATLVQSLPQDQVSEEHFMDAASAQLEGAQRLLSRSLLCWMFVIAVIQLI